MQSALLPFSPSHHIFLLRAFSLRELEKRVPHMPAMVRPRNEAPVREEEVAKFKESQEILDKLFEWQLGLISFFKATDIGEDFFTEHPNVVMAMVLMIELFFLVWLLGTMLRHRVECLQMILVWIVLVLGSVASVLVLTIIYPPIAWFAGLLWVGIFAVTAYYHYHELYKLLVCSVSDIIQKLSESYQRQSI